MPKNITDKDWNRYVCQVLLVLPLSRLLQTTSIDDRVKTWTFLALNENRAERDKVAKEKQKAEYAERVEKQVAFIEASSMSYSSSRKRYLMLVEWVTAMECIDSFLIPKDKWVIVGVDINCLI